MRETLGYYTTRRGGVVYITKDTFTKPSGTIEVVIYRAHYTPGFLMRISIAQGSYDNESLKKVMRKLKRQYPEMKRLKDLGDFQLYAREESDGSIAVNIEQTQDCTIPILAKDVPVGSFLIFNAAYFFSFYKGEDAVLNRILVE